MQRMATLFDIPDGAAAAPAGAWRDDVLPAWLGEIRDRVGDASAPRNVRLFFLRVLMNQPVAAVVRRWAQPLLPAVLACVAAELLTEGGWGVHYFLRDVVFTLRDAWRGAVPDDACAVDATALLGYLLSHAHGGPADSAAAAVGGVGGGEGAMEVDFGADGGDDGAPPAAAAAATAGGAGDSPALKENISSFYQLLAAWAPAGHIGPLDMSCVHALLTTEGAPTGGAHGRATSEGSIAVRKRKCGLHLFRALLGAGYPLLNGNFNVSPGVAPLLQVRCMIWVEQPGSPM